MILLHDIWRGLTWLFETYGTSFFLGGIVFSILTHIIVSKIFKMAMPRKIRKTNLYLKQLKHKKKLLTAFESKMVFIENLLQEMSFEIAETSHELKEIRKEVDEDHAVK